MSENTRRGNKADGKPHWERPQWDYGTKPHRNWYVLEMTESVRNVCEQIRDSQMMQCDVASAIKGMLCELRDLNKNIRGLRRDLKKRQP